MGKRTGSTVTYGDTNVGIRGAGRGALRMVAALGLGVVLALANHGSAAGGASSCPNLPANVNCHDSWMGDMASFIAQRPISQVVIPGSHDSGTFGSFVLPIQTGESQTQDMTILQQLEHGIRSFDLRAEPNCVSFFHPFVCDDLVFVHGPDVTNASLYQALHEIETFSLSHPKEIIILKINLQGAEADTLAPAFCQQFVYTLGGLLVPVDAVNPFLDIGGASGTQGLTVAPTTVQDIWDMGGPRIIANWSGGLACPSVPNTTTWPVGSFGEAYANQCGSGPYTGFSGANPGAIGVIQQFLEARGNATDTPPHSPGTAEVVDGTTSPALGFYNLQIQETKTVDCLITGPNSNNLGLSTSPLVASDAHVITTAPEEQVLDSVRGSYLANQRNARRNLNILSADFPEWTNLMAYTLDLNEAGPQIGLAAQTSGGLPVHSGDVVAEDVTLVATCTGDGSVFGVPRALFFLGGQVINGPPGSGQGLIDTMTVAYRADTETVATAYCVDASGKVAITRFTINNKLPPAVTAALTPPANAAGWHHTDVGVTVTAVDYPGGPGILGLIYEAEGAQTIPPTVPPGSPTGTTTATFTLTEEGTTTVAYAAEDRHGTPSEIGTITVKIDKTMPVMTASAQTASGMTYTAGTWTNQDVTVTFACTDALSGVASVTPPTSLSSSAAEQSVTGTCVDNAGNSTRLTFGGIDIDKTPPVVAYQIAGTLGANSWYTSDVSLTWQAGDPESPIDIAVGCQPASVTADTAGLLFFCQAHSGGGTSGDVQVVIKRDATPPTVTYLGNAGTYAVTDTIAITCRAADSLSGVMSTTCADVNGPAYGFGPGVSSVSASATDRAGNVGQGSTSFHVDVTQSGLCRLTTQLVEASTKYQALPPIARAALDREAKNACASLDLIVPRLTPKQKAVYVAVYDLVVQRLGSQGWLSQALVTTLKKLAGAL